MYSAYKLYKQGDNIQPWHTPFPILNIVHCFMSGSNCGFLICVQVSQEAGKVVWYSHLFKNFPQLAVIQIVRGFSIVKEAKVDVFLEFSRFYYHPTDVGNLISGSSAFSKSSLYIWNFWFTYCWSLTWRILSLTLLACEMSTIVPQYEQ